MTESAPITRRSPSQAYLEGFVTMSAWKKKLLWLATLLAIGGFIGHASSLVMFGRQTTPATQPGEFQRVTGPNVVSGQDVKDAARDMQTRALKWWEWASPHAWKAGLSFVIGFAVGMAARTFLKWLAIFLALGLVVFGALKYFGVVNLNFDTTSAEAAYSAALEYVKENASGAKDWVFQRLPSTVFGTIGLFIGFLRR